MSAFTLTGMLEAIRDRGGFASNDTALTNSFLTRIGNRALWQFSMERDWPWLYVVENKVVSAATFTPAVGWRRTASLVHQDTGQALIRRHVRILDGILTSNVGRPEMYAIQGGIVNIRRVPDTSYVLIHRYLTVEPSLVSGVNETALVPQEFSQPVVEWAASRAFGVKKDFARAQEAKSDYEACLRRITDDVNQSREPIRIEARPGSLF